MGIRTVKPTSPARRYMTFVTNEDITKKTPEKSLLSPKRRTNGRNVHGRITVRHRGGGAKRMLRDVDFRREKFGIPFVVCVREHGSAESILANADARLENTRQQEIETALGEIAKIARLRLEDAL